jgi:RNA polymerase sigma factor (sigma-70 family)
MMTISPMLRTENADAELVAQSLAGDRDAFGRIVARYQVLICSLAYSATGSFAQSEDLSQETFLTAWEQLSKLREPSKLRSWLCGIVRNRIFKTQRRQEHEPVHEAEPLDNPDESVSSEPLPLEQVISHEEEAILWRSLRRIPETYREPLILFYREHESVECVAQALGLSEDAVKQRLSRGRKLLQDQVAVFVEGALKQSAPGPSFTLGVLAALPGPTAYIGAASSGATVAKGGGASKGIFGLAVLNALAGPIVGFLAAFLGYRMSIAEATSERERQGIKHFYLLLIALIVVPVAAVLSAVWVWPLAASHPGLFEGLIIGVTTAWIPAVGLLLFRTRLTRCAQKTESALANSSHQSGSSPSLTGGETDSAAKPAFEYRTRTSLFGLPLVHIRFGGAWVSQRQVVKAWIAGGDTAMGALFAFGGMAAAPICIGGFALGGIVLGGFGAGLICYAGFGVGIWVVGGLVSGLQAVGGCAAGWIAARGGIAVSHLYALGGIALAPHANDAAANEFIRHNAFLQNAFVLITQQIWPIVLLAGLPLLWRWRAMRKRRPR